MTTVTTKQNVGETVSWPEWVRFHALVWLVLSNGIGVLLAVLLAWPSLGDALGSLTYGRWAPLHMNGQLYGWCAVPLVGIAYRWFRGGDPEAVRPLEDRLFLAGLSAWTTALASGAGGWLVGQNSGKLFLEWQSTGRYLLPAAMLLLWCAMAVAAWGQKGRGTGRMMVNIVALAALAAVPFTLFWAASPKVYPSVNPDSGGATGASLFGSTLGLIGVLGLVPSMLRVKRRTPALRLGVIWVVWLAAIGGYGLMDHGHASHHRFGAILALGSLGLWIPLSAAYFRGFSWKPLAGRWLRASWLWWTLLVASGWLTFLPGWSERSKFTHWLVAHAHLAMAGFLTSFLMAVLHELGHACQPPSDQRTLVMWQGCAALHLGALGALGWMESNPAALFLGELGIHRLLVLRGCAGIGMWAVSLVWLARAARCLRAKESRVRIAAFNREFRSSFGP